MRIPLYPQQTMKSWMPCASKIFMTCQRIGYSPISTIRFGRPCVSSDSRVPKPPARMTAFISCFLHPEGRPTPVLLGNHRDADRPRDPEGGIVVSQALLRTGTVELRDFVADLGLVFQRLEAVREAFRHVQHPVIGRRQLRPRPVPVGRGGWSEIDDHVVDRASGAANQLDLGIGRHLVVHAAERPGAGAVREVPLNKARPQPADGKLLLTPHPGEEAPFVPQKLGLDEVRAGELRLGEDDLVRSRLGLERLVRRRSATCHAIRFRTPSQIPRALAKTALWLPRGVCTARAYTRPKPAKKAYLRRSLRFPCFRTRRTEHTASRYFFAGV